MIGKLHIICADGTDPYRNLGLESLLLDLVKDDECMMYLWRNERTVVIGRNQNAYSECRISRLEEDGGHLARRLSGGGAVYHDLGNLNFTFLSSEGNSDIGRQQGVLMGACRSLGIEVETSGRNDLLASGRKFSGNSFYSHRGKSFHNGTIMIETDRDRMAEYLSPSRLKLQSKGVASVRSRTVNLRELQPTLTVEAMKEALSAAFSEVYGLPVNEYALRTEDMEEIGRRTAFFADPYWILGRNADFPVSLEKRFDWGGLCLKMEVKGGIVEDVQVYTDCLDTGFAGPLEDALKLCAFRAESLCLNVRRTPQCKVYENDICEMLKKLEL